MNEPLGDRMAFGKPGIPPTWSSSAKDRVVSSLGSSRLWVSVGHGIVNEVYWPATGQPQTRDLGFIVAGEGFWVELKRQLRYTLRTPKPYIPLPEIVHTGDRYRLTLELVPDPYRDVLLIRTRLAGGGLRCYPLLAPHLGMSGWNNTAWVSDGLYASTERRALCLLSDPPFIRGSAGYVGRSDGWQDFAQHGLMTWAFDRAEDGNVALMGEMDSADSVLALAMAETPEGARTLARSSLAEGYEHVREHFVAGWEAWGTRLELPAATPVIEEAACISATVIRSHEDRTFPGAIVASLSIPWGNSRNDAGGYHLVWTRDAVEAGFGLLAVGQIEDVEHLLAYLAATQHPDGGWPQNFYPDGRPYWTGIQLDEVALPMLLAAKLHELQGAVSPTVTGMVRRAAAFLAHHGPASPQDRWEEKPGASPFTVALEIAALVAAASYCLDESDRDYAFDLADSWNERIEEWTYVVDTEIDRSYHIDGHYIRVSPPSQGRVRSDPVTLAQRDGRDVPPEALVGLEFIYLARLGLRAADDPRLRSSLTVADAMLRVGTPSGAGYHRYRGDAYGEHADGTPFNGTGIGRLWPLLTGERGIMALLQGEDPLPYLETMVAMAGRAGLLPEQVWDGDVIPAHELEPGKPTGSAMPLVWAHAEFLKLLAAREQGRPLERLDAVWERYRGHQPTARTWFWREQVPFETLSAERSLVIESDEPFRLHFGFDGWGRVADRAASPLGLGMRGVRIDAGQLVGAQELNFTRFFTRTERWERADHTIELTRGGSDRES